MAHRRRIGVGRKPVPSRSAPTPSAPTPSSSAPLPNQPVPTAAPTALDSLKSTLASSDLAFVESSVAKLKAELSSFASLHAPAIKRDPALRAKFLRMCGMLHIDPVNTSRTLLGSLLGIGPYYHELALKTAEVCIATRERNGGVVSVAEILRVLRRKEARRAGGGQEIAREDVVLAVGKLGCLGGGFRMLERKGGGGKEGGNLFVVSVPMEVRSPPRLLDPALSLFRSPPPRPLLPQLNNDHVDAIDASASSPLGRGCVNVSFLRSRLSWPEERARRCIESLRVEGVCWEDEHGGQKAWWFMSVWLDVEEEGGA